MRALDFIFFCRPLLLIPVWTIFLLLFDFEYPSISLSNSHLLNLIMLSALTGAGYVINQIYDRDSDRVNGKLGFFDAPSNLSLTSVWVLYTTLLLVAFVYANMSGSLISAYSACAVAGALYSAPFFRGKDRPYSGLALNALPYSVLIWWVVVAEEKGGLEAFGQIDSETGLVLASLALALGGIYLITTVPDVEGDRVTGKKTIAALYGSKVALFGALGLLIGASVAGWMADIVALYSTGALATALAIIAIWSGKDNHVLLAAKAPILVLSLFECYKHPLYGVFLLALMLLTRIYYKRRFGIVYPRLA